MPYPGRVVRVLHEVAAQAAFNAIIGEIVEGVWSTTILSMSGPG